MNVPKQLIVLGNGFDLASGLKSTYSGFFDAVLRNNEVSYTLIKDHFNMYKNGDNFWDKMSSKDKKAILGVNVWILLFINSDLEKDSTWQSVEEQIAKFLNKNLIEIISGAKGKNTYSPGIPEEYQRAATIVNGIIQDKEVNLDFLKNNTAKFLMDELNNLEKEFEQYLFVNAGYGQGEDGQGLFDYFEPARKLLTQIIEDSTDKMQYNLMSFNYTDPWDKRWEKNGGLADDFLHPVKALNVHGQALKHPEDGVNRIIFGIDNRDISINSLNYIFTKTFRTLISYSDVRTPQSAIKNNIFDKSITTIKFFGHSLGKADYSYFQQMFDYYDLYNNDELKLYFYFKQHGSQDVLEHLRLQSEMIIKLLEKYGETMTNKDHGKNLITRLQMTKRLYIKEIK